MSKSQLVQFRSPVGWPMYAQRLTDLQAEANNARLVRIAGAGRTGRTTMDTMSSDTVAVPRCCGLSDPYLLA